MRCPFAAWHGPVPNYSQNGVHRPARGLVLHVIQGSLASADGWFHTPSSQASAHFGCGKDGRLIQWVDTADKAWAEEAGNTDWYSVETEGFDTEPLTPAQIGGVAHLFAWLHDLDGFALQVTDVTTSAGLITHSAGGKAWGGHYCPGDLRSHQRGEIVARAKAITSPIPPTPPEDDNMPRFFVDAKGADDLGRDSFWEVQFPDGNILNWNGARPLKSLGELAATHPPIVAAYADPSGDGLVLVANDGQQDLRGHWVTSTYKILAG